MSAAEQQDADALTGNKAATSLPAAPEDSAVNRARRYALGLRQRLVKDARKRRMRRKLKRAFVAALVNATYTVRMGRMRQLQASVTAAAEEKGVETNPDLWAKVPIWSRGEVTLYSIENQAKRNVAKADPKLVAEIEKWWEIASSNLICGWAAGRLARPEYQAINIKIYRALVAPFDADEARQSAMEDWENDMAADLEAKTSASTPAILARSTSQGIALEDASVLDRVGTRSPLPPRNEDGPDGATGSAEDRMQMDFVRYYQSMFELADNWTDGTGAEDMTDFLQYLYDKVTITYEDGGVAWRDDEDIFCSDDEDAERSEIDLRVRAKSREASRENLGGPRRYHRPVQDEQGNTQMHTAVTQGNELSIREIIQRRKDARAAAEKKRLSKVKTAFGTHQSSKSSQIMRKRELEEAAERERKAKFDERQRRSPVAVEYKAPGSFGASERTLSPSPGASRRLPGRSRSVSPASPGSRRRSPAASRSPSPSGRMNRVTHGHSVSMSAITMSIDLDNTQKPAPPKQAGLLSQRSSSNVLLEPVAGARGHRRVHSQSDLVIEVCEEGAAKTGEGAQDGDEDDDPELAASAAKFEAEAEPSPDEATPEPEPEAEAEAEAEPEPEVKPEAPAEAKPEPEVKPEAKPTPPPPKAKIDERFQIPDFAKSPTSRRHSGGVDQIGAPSFGRPRKGTLAAVAEDGEGPEDDDEEPLSPMRLNDDDSPRLRAVGGRPRRKSIAFGATFDPTRNPHGFREGLGEVYGPTAPDPMPSPLTSDFGPAPAPPMHRRGSVRPMPLYPPAEIEVVNRKPSISGVSAFAKRRNSNADNATPRAIGAVLKRNEDVAEKSAGGADAAGVNAFQDSFETYRETNKTMLDVPDNVSDGSSRRSSLSSDEDEDEMDELLIRNEQGDTPLHTALKARKRAIIDLLLPEIDERVANAVDLDGRTPLHIAASFNMAKTAVGLIAKGAEVDARDDSGSTPLHYAAQTNHGETVEVLLLAKASEGISNRQGLYPVDMTRGKGAKLGLAEVPVLHSVQAEIMPASLRAQFDPQYAETGERHPASDEFVLAHLFGTNLAEVTSVIVNEQEVAVDAASVTNDSVTLVLDSWPQSLVDDPNEQLPDDDGRAASVRLGSRASHLSSPRAGSSRAVSRNAIARILPHRPSSRHTPLPPMATDGHLVSVSSSRKLQSRPFASKVRFTNRPTIGHAELFSHNWGDDVQVNVLVQGSGFTSGAKVTASGGLQVTSVGVLNDRTLVCYIPEPSPDDVPARAGDLESNLGRDELAQRKHSRVWPPIISITVAGIVSRRVRVEPISDSGRAEAILEAAVAESTGKSGSQTARGRKSERRADRSRRVRDDMARAKSVASTRAPMLGGGFAVTTRSSTSRLGRTTTAPAPGATMTLPPAIASEVPYLPADDTLVDRERTINNQALLMRSMRHFPKRHMVKDVLRRPDAGDPWAHLPRIDALRPRTSYSTTPSLRSSRTSTSMSVRPFN